MTPDDIAVANRLAAEVLARSLDELPPQTRRFLTTLDQWVTAESTRQRLPREALRFRAREVREALGLGSTQTKLHLARLVDLEYVLGHRAVRGQGVVYELVYQRDDATMCGYDPLRSVLGVLGSGGGRPPAGPRSGVGRSGESDRNTSHDHALVPRRSDQSPRHVNGRAPAGSHVPA